MIYPHFDYIAFGRALVEYREDNHLTRQAMAGMARIKADKLRRLEHGQLPDIRTFAVLCSLMNLTPNEFFNMVVYPDNRMNIAPMWNAGTITLTVPTYTNEDLDVFPGGHEWKGSP